MHTLIIIAIVIAFFGLIYGLVNEKNIVTGASGSVLFIAMIFLAWSCV